MTLIRDLINIPESVRKGDFVLRLTEGVSPEHAARTLADYEVTPQLAKCFTEALSLIKAGLETRSSKATYLHGSFGSGKSHFMAVLHLLLQGNITARSIPSLSGPIAAHSSWLLSPAGTGKKCLLVPFNLLAATSFEQALFGQYIEHVGKLHPEAPLPGVFAGDKIIADADNMRAMAGDAKFFATLSAGDAGAAGWGKLSAGWTAESYEAAKAADPRSSERSRLIGTLVEKVFKSVRTSALTAQGGESYVNVDDGLSILSKHAQSLGYEGLVLFLDELILWLATNAADPAFVGREIQKLVKIIEPQNPDRPVPIISFISRQRDLRELVGKDLAGSQQLGFGDQLKFWDGRFGTITLEDRNLPAIAKKRVLAPRDEAAKGQIDAAFATTRSIREDLRNTLLTSKADEAAFRDVYPFSPALVETLVAVSSHLQRERTALKVMALLLLEQRDTLKLGQLVPVGDLYDLVAQGDEAVTEGIKRSFEEANRLYHHKLLPLLEARHGAADQVKALAWDDPKRAAFRSDDRILKTLLLAALAPQVESLKNLTPRKIAALNHGSFKSAIPGNEPREISRKLREWAGSVGEIRIGEDPQDPIVAIQLTGVDTQSIIDSVKSEDTPGNRQAKIRELVFKAVGIEDSKGFFTSHTILWRGWRRTVDVSYGNIRDKESLADSAFRSQQDNWKIVIDFPFDDGHHTPLDDLARVHQLTESLSPQRTLCWIPSFLKQAGQANVGLLVKLDYLLTLDRLATYTSHLSVADRNTAKLLLENQRAQVQRQLNLDLDAAYGVTDAAAGDRVDLSHELDGHFKCIDSGFEPRPPVSASLKGCFEALLDQALRYQFPKAPQFDGEIRVPMLKRAHAELQKAVQAEGGRTVVEQSLRREIREVVNPLNLGNMGEQALVLEQNWKTHLLAKRAAFGKVPTVADVRKWINLPEPMGLPKAAENLIILVAAEQAGWVCKHAGRVLTPGVEDLDDVYELHEQVMPSLQSWKEANLRASGLFGYGGLSLLSAGNIAALCKICHENAKAYKNECQQLFGTLQTHMPKLGIDPTTAPRSRTAAAVLLLLQSLERASPDTVVEVLATAPLATEAMIMGKSMKSAGAVNASLVRGPWSLLTSIGTLADERQPVAAGILATLRQTLEAEEFAAPIEPALKAAEAQATALLVRPVAAAPVVAAPAAPVTPVPPVLPVPITPTPVTAPRGKVRRLVGEKAVSDVTGADALGLLESLEQQLRADSGLRLDIAYKITRLEDAPG